MTSLQGKTLLVTGASSGIGQALCDRLVHHGANVLGVTRRPSALPDTTSPIEADLNQTRAAMKMLDPGDVADAILTILSAPPHVEVGDILMRSAGQQM